MYNKIALLIFLLLPLNILSADIIGDVTTYVDRSYNNYIEEKKNYSNELYNSIALSLKNDSIEILKDKSNINLLSSIEVTGYMNFFEMLIALDKVKLFTYALDNKLINFEKNRDRYIKIIKNNKSSNIREVVKDKLNITIVFKDGINISTSDILSLESGEIILKEYKTNLGIPVYKTQLGDKSFYYYDNIRYDALGFAKNFVESHNGTLMYNFYKDNKSYVYSKDKIYGPYQIVKSIISGVEGKETYYITKTDKKFSLHTLDETLLENVDNLNFLPNRHQNVFTYKTNNIKHIYIPGVMDRADNYSGNINVDKYGIYYNYSKDINSSGWKNVDSKKLNYMFSNNLELGPYESIRKITNSWFQGYANGDFYIFNRDGFRYGPYTGDSNIKSYFSDIITINDKNIVNTPLEMDKITPFKRWTRSRYLLILNSTPLKVLTSYGVVVLGERAELIDFSEGTDYLTFSFGDNTVTRIDVNPNDFSKSASRTFQSSDGDYQNNDLIIAKNSSRQSGSNFQTLGNYNYASEDNNTKLLGPFPRIINYTKKEGKEFLFIEDFDKKYYLINRDRTINKHIDRITNGMNLHGSFRFLGSGEDLESSIVLSISNNRKYYSYFSFNDSYYRGIQTGVVKGDKIAYIPLDEDIDNDNRDSYYRITFNGEIIDLPEYTLVQRIGLDSSGNKMLAADPSEDYIYYVDETGTIKEIEQNNSIDFLRFLENSTDYFLTGDYELFSTKTGEYQRVKSFKNSGEITGCYNYKTKMYIDSYGKISDLSGYQDYSVKREYVLMENDRDKYIFLNGKLHGPSSSFVDGTVDNNSNSFVYYNRDSSSNKLYFDGTEYSIKKLVNRKSTYSKYSFNLSKDNLIYITESEGNIILMSTGGTVIDLSETTNNNTEFYYDSGKIYWYSMSGNILQKNYIKR